VFYNQLAQILLMNNETIDADCSEAGSKAFIKAFIAHNIL
jgi:hypothetical protein